MMRRLYTPPSANRSSCQRSRCASSFSPLHHQIGTGEKLRLDHQNACQDQLTLRHLSSSLFRLSEAQWPLEGCVHFAVQQSLCFFSTPALWWNHRTIRHLEISKVG